MNLRHTALTVVCGLMLAACSRQDRPSIIGHWQAERTTVFSAHLPVGPDIVISEQAVAVPGTEAQIPLNGISQKDNEAVLELPYGVGVSFFFDGPDRIHFDAPVLGKVYYRRVHDAIAAQAAPQQDAKAQAAGPVTASAVVPAVAVQTQRPPSPPVQVAPVSLSEHAPEVPHRPVRPSAFDQAVLAARQGDQDSAIDNLNEALKQGFRGFDKIDAAPEFASLRQDVRYQALLAHYR
ncbi:hypothetical protein PQR08_32225 [Caballeronia jiangsuensis]|uniref:Lipoprotein n=1 Tax=Caballeronia jiangsuensis TaxID=1458357 RepID=A0ABW9CVK1_9BURK